MPRGQGLKEDDPAKGLAPGGEKKHRFCPHQRRKETCKQCGGSQICEHNRERKHAEAGRLKMPEEHVLDSSVAGSEDDDQADDDGLDLSRKPWTKEVMWT